MAEETPKKRIVVVGGGLAGLLVAQKLNKRKDSQVILVSDKDYFIFLPRLTELFGKSAPEKHIIAPLKNIWKGSLVIDKANLVNPGDKTVVLNSGQTIAYDILVLAVGSKPNYFNTPGSQYSYSFYSKEDSDKLNEHVQRMLEADEQAGTHTFVVVGGGPTGVEVAYVLNKLVKQKRSKARVIIMERNKLLLQMLSEKLSTAATGVIQQQGIEIMTSTGVLNITPMSIEIQKPDGAKENLPCYTTVWAAGSMPQQLPITGVQLSPKGEVTVLNTLQAQQHPEIFCLGDYAATNTPKTAQSAVQQAACAADNISSLLDEKPLQQFKLEDKGTVIALEKDTVGLFYGKLLKGFLAQQGRDKYYRYMFSQFT